MVLRPSLSTVSLSVRKKQPAGVVRNTTPVRRCLTNMIPKLSNSMSFPLGFTKFSISTTAYCIGVLFNASSRIDNPSSSSSSVITSGIKVLITL